MNKTERDELRALAEAARPSLLAESRELAAAQERYRQAACNAVPALLDAIDEAEVEVERLNDDATLGRNLRARIDGLCVEHRRNSSVSDEQLRERGKA